MYIEKTYFSLVEKNKDLALSKKVMNDHADNKKILSIAVGELTLYSGT